MFKIRDFILKKTDIKNLRITKGESFVGDLKHCVFITTIKTLKFGDEKSPGLKSLRLNDGDLTQIMLETISNETITIAIM